MFTQLLFYFLRFHTQTFLQARSWKACWFIRNFLLCSYSRTSQLLLFWCTDPHPYLLILKNDDKSDQHIFGSKTKAHCTIQAQLLWISPSQCCVLEPPIYFSCTEWFMELGFLFEFKAGYHQFYTSETLGCFPLILSPFDAL